MSRFTFAVLVVLALMVVGAPIASAQSDGEDVELPPWVDNLAIGTVGVIAFASALTQISKWLLNLVGVLGDGWGRYILAFWVGLLIVVLFVTDVLELHETIDPAVEWLYALAIAFLDLFVGAWAYEKAKMIGLAKEVTSPRSSQRGESVERPAYRRRSRE